MSNSESLIEEIEEKYRETRRIVESASQKAETAYDAKRRENWEWKELRLSDNEGLEIFKIILRFQTFLESREKTLMLFDGLPYYPRAKAKFARILDLVRSDENLTNGSPSYRGLHAEAKKLVDDCKTEAVFDAKYSLTKMTKCFEDMELDLSELYADLRLLQDLMTLPIEQKTRLKSKLMDLGFEATAKFLEDAERNLISDPPQLRDVMTNCRSALELILHDLLLKHGITPRKWFSKDLMALSKEKPALIDEPLTKLMRGAYDFLSLKGPHPYSKVDQKNLSEVLYGLEHTYSLLSMILVRYTALTKSAH